MIRHTFFDVGGVLREASVRSLFEELKKRHPNLDENRYRAFMWDSRTLTDPNGTIERLLNTEFGDLGFRAEELMGLFRARPRYERVWEEIAKELRRRERPVGILSDQSAEGAEFLRFEYGLPFLFDPVIFSSDRNVRLTKEDRRIFDLARDRVGIEAADLLMIDDNPRVVDVARGAGWKTIHYTDHESLRRELVSYGLL